MTVALRHRGCSIFAVLAILTASRGLAGQLTEEQKDRASLVRGVVDRAVGHWENPNFPNTVTLNGGSGPLRKDLEMLRRGAAGTYIERTRGGDHVGGGTWQFDAHGSGTLTWPTGKTRALLVADNVLALQPFTAKGGLHEDGVVLFRVKYDFEGLKSEAVLSTEQHQDRISGRWTHPNLDAVHEVTKEGLWHERRKKGGIRISGTWQIHDDGTYFVELDNQWRLRIWPWNNDKLVVIWFGPDGAMHGDGAILSRE